MTEKVTAPVPGEKAITMLAAAVALKGHELRRTPDGRYLVACWGLTRELPTLADAEAFLRQIGGAACPLIRAVTSAL